MKITIELTDAEVRGIKEYLKEVGDNPRPTKQDITVFIDGIVQSIHNRSEAVSDYIKQFEKL